MNRVLLVARREFISNVKRRSFLFSAFLLPLIVIAAQFAIGYFVGQQGHTTGTLGSIGYVDLTPDQILSSAANRPSEYRAFSDQDSARAALLRGEIGAFFVVPAGYVAEGVIDAFGIKDVPRGIEAQMSRFLTDNLLVGWPRERAIRLRDPDNLTFSTLDGDKEVEDDESAIAVILVPILFAVLFMMSIFTTSAFLLQGVVEEKESRLIEILVTSITPVQMLWGKILGLAALGLLQIIVWTTAGGVVLVQGSSVWESLENVSLPTPLLVWAPIYLLLGYLLYGALLASIGATVTSLQEGQQISGIVSLIAALPIFFAVTFIRNANGPVPTLLSLVPFTAPIAIVMRLPFADVPLWQIGLSLVLLVLTSLAIVRIAAQVFRVGLLMYGRRLGLRSLWIAVRRGLEIAPHSQGEPR